MIERIHNANIENLQKVAGWGTSKVEGGYKYRVYSFDYQVAEVTHFQGVRPTRAQAIGMAKRCVRYIHSLQRKAGK